MGQSSSKTNDTIAQPFKRIGDNVKTGTQTAVNKTKQGVMQGVDKTKQGATQAGQATAGYVTNKRGLASDLNYYAMPVAAGAAGTAAGTVAGGPMGGVMGGMAGSMAGKMAADKIATDNDMRKGYGLHIDINSHNAHGRHIKSGMGFFTDLANDLRPDTIDPRMSGLIQSGVSQARDLVGRGLFDGHLDKMLDDPKLHKLLDEPHVKELIDQGIIQFHDKTGKGIFETFRDRKKGDASDWVKHEEETTGHRKEKLPVYTGVPKRPTINPVSGGALNYHDVDDFIHDAKGRQRQREREGRGFMDMLYAEDKKIHEDMNDRRARGGSIKKKKTKKSRSVSSSPERESSLEQLFKNIAKRDAKTKEKEEGILRKHALKKIGGSLNYHDVDDFIHDAKGRQRQRAFEGRGLKGSPEMKEKMAKLRAMRKTK